MREKSQENGDLLEILNRDCECYWSIEEKNKCKEGIRIHGKNWKLISKHVDSKNYH